MKIPKKLKVNDEVRIIAPSRSLSIISNDVINTAVNVLEGLGLKVSFAKNTREIDDYNSSSIHNRIEDLHEAFLDKNVKAILTTIGGFNANQLLPHMDFDLIENNPKILCGYSDITVILNAIYEKCGLITYYGPHFSSFGVKKGNQHTVDYFKKCLFSSSSSSSSLQIESSDSWSDDEWYLDQKNRTFIKNEGIKVIQHGEAKGVLIGGNLDTFNLLQGTGYLPSNKKVILFIEEDNMANEYFNVEFDRNITSLFQTYSKRINGIIMGRFQQNEKMNIKKLEEMINRNKLHFGEIPVIYGLDFGHTLPMITLPVGGEINIKTNSMEIDLIKW